jgi:hypothetical protein
MKVAYIHTESQKYARGAGMVKFRVLISLSSVRFALCFALEKAVRMVDGGEGRTPLVQLSLGMPMQQSLLSLMAEVPWLRKLSEAGEEPLASGKGLLEAIVFS